MNPVCSRSNRAGNLAEAALTAHGRRVQSFIGLHSTEARLYVVIDSPLVPPQVGPALRRPDNAIIGALCLLMQARLVKVWESCGRSAALSMVQHRKFQATSGCVVKEGLG